MSLSASAPRAGKATSSRIHNHHSDEPGTQALPSRIDSLTSLRFFAACAVFAHHFTGLGGKTGLARAPLIFPYSMMGGIGGVTFFFVLSGFLLTWVYRPGEHPGAFYWRRVGRIWPAHLVATLLAVWAYYLGAHVRIHWPSFISSLFLVQTWFPNVTPTLPGNEVSWTLSVEVTFYALFPFAARAALRLSTQVLGLLTVGGFLYMFAAASYAGAHPHSLIATWVCRPPVYYLPQFLLGMTLAVALKRGFRLRIHPVVPIALLLAYDIAYYKLRAHASPVTRSLLDHTLLITISILAGLIIVAFVQREIAGRKGLLSKRPAMLLGAWSYCFYLLHHSVSRLATYQWGHQPDNNAALFTMLGMGVFVLLLSWALYSTVEEPAERWMRGHIPQRWRSRPLHTPEREPRAPEPATAG